MRNPIQVLKNFEEKAKSHYRYNRLYRNLLKTIPTSRTRQNASISERKIAIKASAGIPSTDDKLVQLVSWEHIQSALANGAFTLLIK